MQRNPSEIHDGEPQHIIGPARQAAAQVLSDVLRRERFADDALDEVLEEMSLRPDDRRLCVQLVNGVLRHLTHIDRALDALASKGKESLPPHVLIVLRIALFQMLYLDRIPVHAIVSSAVEQAKALAPGLAGLVNAILRRASEDPQRWRQAPLTGDPAADLALAYDHPRWLVERWLVQFGVDQTAALCEANQREPSLFVRVHTLRIQSDALQERLAGEGIAATPHAWLDDALVLPPHTVLGSLAAFQEGLFVVQDISAMLPARLVAPVPGERILDACAAPGGKTAHLAALLCDRGTIYAVDRDPRRVGLIKAMTRRLGLTCVRVRAQDATRGIPGMPQHVDAVLVDAPCSGLGTLARRVDLRWRIQPEDLERLRGLQREILARVGRKVRPGGRLVYSTCTINPEENEDVVREFLRRFPQFAIDDPRPFLPVACRHLVSHDGFVRTFPHTDGVDGSFAVRLVRTAAERAGT